MENEVIKTDSLGKAIVTLDNKLKSGQKIKVVGSKTGYVDGETSIEIAKEQVAITVDQPIVDSNQLVITSLQYDVNLEILINGVSQGNNFKTNSSGLAIINLKNHKFKPGDIIEVIGSKDGYINNKVVVEIPNEEVNISVGVPSEGSKQLIVKSFQDDVILEIYVDGIRQLENEVIKTDFLGRAIVTLDNLFKAGQEILVVGSKKGYLPAKVIVTAR